MAGTAATSCCYHIQFLDSVLSELCIDLWFIFSDVGLRICFPFLFFHVALPLLSFYPSQKMVHSLGRFLSLVWEPASTSKWQDSWIPLRTAAWSLFLQGSQVIIQEEKGKQRGGEERREEERIKYSVRKNYYQYWWLPLTTWPITMKVIIY